MRCFYHTKLKLKCTAKLPRKLLLFFNHHNHNHRRGTVFKTEISLFHSRLDKRYGNSKELILSDFRNTFIQVLQNFGLLADKTVYENISYPLIFNPAVKYKMMKRLIAKTADAMLIGDLLKKPVKELSGGQKQRVALARALVNRPNIIIADEPTAALDKATADEIMEVMKSLNSIGKTIVIVTHDRTVAEKCRRIVELSDGKIISDRTIA